MQGRWFAGLDVGTGVTSISYSINQEKTNVIMGKEIVDLRPRIQYVTDFIGDVKYQISPLSFYQVNPIHRPSALLVQLWTYRRAYR